MCLTPNPFSHVLTLAEHGESMWKTEGCFWLRTGEPTGPLTQWACHCTCRWPVPGLQGSSVPFRLVRGWATQGPRRAAPWAVPPWQGRGSKHSAKPIPYSGVAGWTLTSVNPRNSELLVSQDLTVFRDSEP